MDRIERLHFLITNFIRLTLVIAFIGAFLNQRWTVIFVVIITFILTFFPFFFERRYKIYLPIEFEIVIIIFIYATLFLGEVQSYYELYWWWDVLLHGSSAIAFGFIGFIILYILYSWEKITGKPFWIAVFSFCFAMAIGSLWEIFEFFMDQTFGLSMQKSGLIDTMWDLIVDGIGALIASISGYFYIKKREIFLFGNVIKRFEYENPSFFKNEK